jgi:Domain of unknown function (DUF397)
VYTVQRVDLSQRGWHRSTCSGGNGACVEVAFLSDAVAVRDSKHRGGPVHVFTPREWAAFVGGVLSGEFGRP